MEEFLDHTPLTEEEALGLFPMGDYPCVIEKMEIKTSKAGNRCFVATIAINDPAKNAWRNVTTWFGLPYLLKHAYEGAGLTDKYQSAKLSTRDLEGKKLMARVKVREGNEQYPQPKNEIYDFVIKPVIDKETIANIPDFDDSLPF